MYDNIINPNTGKKVSVGSKKGLEIIRNYVNILQGGSKGKKKSKNSEPNRYQSRKEVKYQEGDDIKIIKKKKPQCWPYFIHVENDHLGLGKDYIQPLGNYPKDMPCPPSQIRTKSGSDQVLRDSKGRWKPSDWRNKKDEHSLVNLLENDLKKGNKKKLKTCDVCLSESLTYYEDRLSMAKLSGDKEEVKHVKRSINEYKDMQSYLQGLLGKKKKKKGSGGKAKVKKTKKTKKTKTKKINGKNKSKGKKK